MAVVLQMDFVVPSAEISAALSKNAPERAESITREPGFISKIWTFNADTHEAGGIYIFTDHHSAQKYLEMHKARLALFGIHQMNCKIFDINVPLTR